MAKILYGEPIARHIQSEILTEIDYYDSVYKSYRQNYGATLDYHHPKLRIIKSNSDDASKVYVNNKMRFCNNCNIDTELIEVESSDVYLNIYNSISDNDTIVQYPVDGLSQSEFNECIDDLIHPSLDVDKLTSDNVGKLWNYKTKELNNKLYLLSNVPCTPNAVYAFLKHYNYLDELKGKHAVIIGRSNLVGKPLAKVLLDCDMTVTVCHSKTENLKEIASQADLLVCAIGKAKFITSDYVKDNAIVIDVGINRDEYGKLCGDVDFNDVRNKCKAITPVPKGVGVVTTAMVAANVFNDWLDSYQVVILDDYANNLVGDKNG